MLILLICIACNVMLAVIFKGFYKYQVDNLHAIIANYFVCVLVASAFLGTSALPVNCYLQPWFWHSLLLAFLFIVGFNVLALSFQKSGVALTIIIQKMSLVIPSAFAIVFYKEDLNFSKGLGILAAMAAVVLVNWPSSQEKEYLNWKSFVILLPLSTFILSGIIEILLFYVEVEGITANDGMRFTASSFGFAGIMGLLFSLFSGRIRKVSFGKKEIAAGLILGLPNFFTIYLLLVLLGMGWEASILFPSNSIGILLITAIIGFVFYKEKVNGYKLLGLLSGLMAIALISLS